MDPPDGSFDAAVLLADISGYSAMAARLAELGAGGAEVLSQQLSASFAVMLREVHARGGEVERFAGDALLATFRPGADSLADAVLRARDCAAAITARLDGTGAADVALGVHAGVAAGTLHTRHVQLAGGDRAFVLAGPPLAEVAVAAAEAPMGTVRLATQAAILAATADGSVGALSIDATRTPVIPARHLAPYISRALRDRLGVAANTGWMAELRWITAVFVKPYLTEPTASALALVAGVLGETALRFDGLLHELGVDDKGLVAVLLFGLHHTHEDEAQRALRAAHAVHAGLAGVGLRSSLGVASGRVYCGVVGDAWRSELAVVGDPMNLAARLMQAAGDGVLCDLTTADEPRARQAFAFSAVHGLILKGMPAGLTPQRPLPRDAAARQTSQTPTPGPLGRHLEWHAVLELLRAVPALRARRAELEATDLAGHGALLIEGDAGIGKSALLSAAVTEAGRLGAALLHVHGQALEQVSPYQAWRRAVAQLLGVDLAADGSVQVARLQLALAGDPQAAALAPLLAAVLPHAPRAHASVDALDAQASAEQLREMLLTLLARAAASVPLMIVVEDAQWLDSASWSLLQAVSSRRLPVLVLMSSRPLKGDARSLLSAWQKAAAARLIELGPLSRDAAAELMRRKLGVTSLTDGVESLVHARAAGHPFFTEELVLALRDSGALRIDSGLCALAASNTDLSEQLVPDTLARALTARIDGISEAQRLTLKVASVLGRDFGLSELQATHPLHDEREQLQERLQALVAHELLVAQGQGNFSFKHAITRDVAYGLLPFALRRDLHRTLAEHLAGDAAQAADPQRIALLAHHWSHAEVPDQALAASEAAGLQAFHRFANREAVHFLREALRWDEVLGKPTGRERVAHWLSLLGLSHRLLGELEASRIQLEAALRELGAAVPAKTPAARLRTIWALLQFALRRPRVGPAGQAHNAANTAVEAYAQLTMLAYYDHDIERMTACSVLAASVAQRAAPSREVAALYGSLAHTALFFRLRAAMRHAMDATQQVAERVPSALVVGTACQFTGHLSACQGDFTRFEADMKRAGTAYRQLGRCRQLDEADTNLACLYTHQGQLDRAHELSVKLEQSGRARDDLQVGAWGVIGRARVRFAQARFTEVLTLVEDTCFSLAVDRLTLIEATALHALSLLRCDQPDEALEQALKVLVQLEKAPSTSYFSLLSYGYVMETLVQLCHKPSASAATRAKAREAAPRMLKALRSYAGLLPMARVQLAVWTGALAHTADKPASALAAWRRALQLARISQVPLDLPMAQRWLAHALDGPAKDELLRQAAEGFAALGREFEAAEARAAAGRRPHADTRNPITRMST